MDDGSDESVLPTVLPTYFTHATSVVSEVPVTDAIRSTFGLSSDINKVDMLQCPSHEYECNGVDCDVSLWFCDSTRRYAAKVGTRRQRLQQQRRRRVRGEGSASAAAEPQRRQKRTVP